MLASAVANGGFAAPILQSISVMGKNVREELEARLKYRNACGHPSSLKIVESRVVAHIETLMANVFESYS